MGPPLDQDESLAYKRRPSGQPWHCSFPRGVKYVTGTGTQVFTSRQLRLVMNECLCTQGEKYKMECK